MCWSHRCEIFTSCTPQVGSVIRNPEVGKLVPVLLAGAWIPRGQGAGVRPFAAGLCPDVAWHATSPWCCRCRLSLSFPPSHPAVSLQPLRTPTITTSSAWTRCWQPCLSTQVRHIGHTLHLHGALRCEAAGHCPPSQRACHAQALTHPPPAARSKTSAVDAPSLALIIPVVHRGLRDRSGERRPQRHDRMGATRCVGHPYPLCATPTQHLPATCRADALIPPGAPYPLSSPSPLLHAARIVGNLCTQLV